jgi:hypothetical protein
MNEKKVEITLGKDGSVRIEAFGFVGGSCEEAVTFLDELLGKPADRKYKDSYYQNKETLINSLPNGYCG